MKLISRLRRPTIARPSSGRKPFKPGGIRFLAAAAAVLAVSFILGVYLFLPTEALRGYLEATIAERTPLQVAIDNLSATLPPGLEASGVTVRTARSDSLWSMDFASVAAAPVWSSLFGSDPGVAVSAHSGNGEVSLRYHRRGEFEASFLDFPLVSPLAAGSAMTLSGTIAEGTVSGAAPLRPETESAFQLNLAGVQLSGLEALGVKNGLLPLGRVTLRGNGRGSQFKLERIEAREGAFLIDGEGTLSLERIAARSRLAMTVTLRPSAAAPREVVELLEIVGQKTDDGAIRFRISGTLGNPALR